MGESHNSNLAVKKNSPIMLSHGELKTGTIRAGEMAQQLIALADLPEDPGSVNLQHPHGSSQLCNFQFQRI